jgi:hypothetical protein
MRDGRELAQLIFDLHGHKGELSCQTMVKLLDLMIKEAREFNDNVQPNELEFNQGRIAGWKLLKGYIEEGNRVPLATT